MVIVYSSNAWGTTVNTNMEHHMYTLIYNHVVFLGYNKDIITNEPKPIMRNVEERVPLDDLVMPLQQLLREAHHLVKTQDILELKVLKGERLIGHVYKRKAFVTIESFEKL